MRTDSTSVEVRSSFLQDHWASGFEVAEVIRLEDRELYRLRRRSDGAVLPTLFDREDVRRATRV